MSVAVIDIGSNSVRYMLYNPATAINKKFTNSTVLGEGLATSGLLKEQAILRTANAVAEFVTQAKNAGANSIFIFATEAVRAAKNRADFTDLVFSKTNIAVDVISGALEAQIGFSGVISDSKSSATVIDIGGASVEIISGKAGKIEYCKSLPLGLVRLRDLLGSNRQKIHDYIQKNILEFGAIPHIKNIIAIGGTATSVGSMSLLQSVYNPLEIHGSVVTLATLREMENKVFASANIMQDFPTISLARSRIIGHGIIMLIELLEFLKADKITVSELDNLEGYAMYKSEQIK